MKPKSLTVAVLGLAPLCLALSGSGAFAQTTTDTTGSAPAQTAPAYSLDSTLAEVDGKKLSLGELIAIRRQLPEQYQSLPDEVLMTGLVEQLIDQMILSEAGRKAGLDKRPIIALNLLNSQRAILADAFLRDEVGKRVTDEATEKLYKERYVDAPPEQEIHARHILVATEDEAKAIKEQLDGGADFAALAAAHGTDGTSSRGGDLGWFVRKDMVPEFSEAAFAIEPGSIGGPVQSPFGWHVIKVEESRDRAAPPIEEVRDALARDLIQQAQAEIMTELRASANIVMADPPLPSQAVRNDQMLDLAE